jgi:hypothetical protein
VETESPVTSAPTESPVTPETDAPSCPTIDTGGKGKGKGMGGKGKGKGGGSGMMGGGMMGGMMGGSGKGGGGMMGGKGKGYDIEKRERDDSRHPTDRLDGNDDDNVRRNLGTGNGNIFDECPEPEETGKGKGKGKGKGGKGMGSKGKGSKGGMSGGGGSSDNHGGSKGRSKGKGLLQKKTRISETNNMEISRSYDGKSDGKGGGGRR